MAKLLWLRLDIPIVTFNTCDSCNMSPSQSDIQPHEVRSCVTNEMCGNSLSSHVFHMVVQPADVRIEGVVRVTRAIAEVRGRYLQVRLNVKSVVISTYPSSILHPPSLHKPRITTVKNGQPSLAFHCLLLSPSPSFPSPSRLRTKQAPIIYLIRHGEKPPKLSDGKDPDGLSAQGLERAQGLRQVFGRSSSYNINYIIAEQPKKGILPSSFQFPSPFSFKLYKEGRQS